MVFGYDVDSGSFGKKHMPKDAVEHALSLCY